MLTKSDEFTSAHNLQLPSESLNETELLSTSFTSSTTSSSSSFSLSSPFVRLRAVETKQSKRQSVLFKRIFVAMHFVFFFLLVLWFFSAFLGKSSTNSSNDSFYKITAKLFGGVTDDVDPSLNPNYRFQTKCQIYDSHDGNLSRIWKSDKAYTFIYLYANWCARSINYRELIEQLACDHSEQMSFVAVNCFSQKGECRSAFNLMRYPQIVVHVRDIGFLVYKGPFEYNYLGNYLKSVHRPLERIDSFDEFIDFVFLNDRVVVGHFNFSDKSDNQLFKMFYEAALKILNLDSENPIKYAVVVDTRVWRRINSFSRNWTAKTLMKRKIICFSMYGFEKSLRLTNYNISSDYLVNWSYRYARPTIIWYYPDQIQFKKSEANKFLIFHSRNFGPPYNLTLRSLQLNIKFLIVENFFNSYESSLFYDYLKRNLFQEKCHRGAFFGNDSRTTNKFWCERTSEPVNGEFFYNTELLLVDSNLYANYAASLVGNNQIQMPFSLLIDYKNESLFVLEQELTYKNMKNFIKNNEFGLNKRYLKSSSNRNQGSNSGLKNIEDISSSKLVAILENANTSSSYERQDLLLFYYNNWCGFCNLVNHKLLILAHKYFRNVETFKIIKIDVDNNDFPWYIHTSRVPTLLFIPSAILDRDRAEGNIGERETIQFNLSPSESNINALEVKHLAKFVLENAKNPQTLVTFLKDNYLNAKNKYQSNDFDLTKSSKLRYDLINIVSSRQKRVEDEIQHLAHLNDIPNSKYFSLNLSKLLFELEILKNFTALFNN